MQSTSSGSHGGSSYTVWPRAEPGAGCAAPPLDEAEPVRTLLGIDERIELRPNGAVGDTPFARIVRVAIDGGVLPVGDDVVPPIAGIACARDIVEVGAPRVRIAACPDADWADVPIAGIDDGELVEAPIDGALVAPMVESVGPINEDEVAPSVVESVVEGAPVVASEVSAGSVAKAEAPTPNFAAKELKSVVPAKPSVASKASKAGSDEAGSIVAVSIGNVSAAGLETVLVVVPRPPNVVLELSVDCAAAIQGVAMSATGATHPMILFISPPCSNLLVHIDHGLAQPVPRGAVGRLAYHEVRGAIRYFVFPLLSSRGVSGVPLVRVLRRHRRR